MTWKPLQVSAFCLLVTQTGEKIRMSSQVNVTGQGQGHFSDGSRSLSKVTTYELFWRLYFPVKPSV